MTRRLPKPITPPRCVTNAFTSLTRYTCAGIVCSVDDATPFNTSNSCGESAVLSGGPGGTKRSMRGSTAQTMVPARATHTRATLTGSRTSLA